MICKIIVPTSLSNGQAVHTGFVNVNRHSLAILKEVPLIWVPILIFPSCLQSQHACE